MLGESHPTGCQLRFLNQNLAWNSKATWGNIKRLVWLLSCNSSSQSDQRSLGGPENFTGILWGQTILLLPRGHLHFSLVNTGLHCSWSKTRSPLAQGKAVEANWICSPLLHHSGKIQSKPTEELPWWSEFIALHQLAPVPPQLCEEMERHTHTSAASSSVSVLLSDQLVWPLLSPT